MAEKIAIEDPHHIQDTLCDGPFNVTVHPPLATLTFTNQQPDIDGLFSGDVKIKNFVTSRLTMPLTMLVTLRDILSQVIVQHEKGTEGAFAASGGSGRPH